MCIRDRVSTQSTGNGENAMATESSPVLADTALALSLEEAEVLRVQGAKVMKQAKWGVACSLCSLGLSWIPFCCSGAIDVVKPLKKRYDAKGIFVPPMLCEVTGGETGNIAAARCEDPHGPMPKIATFFQSERGQKMLAKLQRLEAKKQADATKVAQPTDHGTMAL
eukprot:TRINITY_DN10962_c0_g1_i5.p1 TRINITY_DN10962_c0_g1~~TRINITY_DN10962_c0_g1_i5.p1  ORF type:complete len:166 (-),score=48.50 TRINITY_DN10962_c0_g1_i5:308-805(-)